MTPFDSYDIHGVHEFNEDGRKFCEQVPDDQATFWTLYGHIPGEGVMAIGDFATRVQAEEAFQRITGLPFAETSEVQGRIRVMHAGPRLLEALRLASDRLGTLIDADEDTENDCKAYDAVCAAIVEAAGVTAQDERGPGNKPSWQSEAERLAGAGYTVNVATTPHGCCASIISERKPYEIYRCQLAPSLKTAFEDCRKQMETARAEGRAA